MKSAFFTVLCLLFAGLSASGQENFKVIKVNGTIVLKTKGVSLETGTVFSEKEDLLFRSDDANAAVINPQRGRIIITSKSHNLAQSGSNYLPAMYNISKRGGLPGDPDELDAVFSGRYVVLDRDEVFIDHFVYPIDNEHFFFLRYSYKGEEINKKLASSGDTLIIDKKELYTIDGKPIPSPDNTRIKLFYMNGVNAMMVSEFNLIFPDTKQLAEEVKVILDTFTDKTPSQKVTEINNYITEEYGKVNRKFLLSWLNTTFNINAR
jgi:hypothetical protein